MKGKNSILNNSRFRPKGYAIFILALILMTIWCLFETKPALAQEASKETLTSAANVVTAANTLTIEESLLVGDVTKSVKAETKEAFLSELKDLEERILSHGIRYDWNHPAKSYQSAINGNHQVNCATYVSWALQEMGYLPSGKVFYISDTLHGKAASIIKNSDRFTVRYNVGRVSSVKLKPGDIVGWKTHTCVYAGKDSSGNRLWYTAGGKDIGSKNLGPRTKGYDNKYITVLIRLNN